MTVHPPNPLPSPATVAVTKPEFQKAEAEFRRAFEAEGRAWLTVPVAEAPLAEAIRAAGARHAIVGPDLFTGPLYHALPAGGVIARFGVGHDGVDKAQATARGLLCANTPGVLDDSVAEHAINLLLAAARHTVAAAVDMRDGRWRPQVGVELKGKTLAVIGCGPIGRRTAAIATRGFGLRVIGCKRTPDGWDALRRSGDFADVTTDFAAAVGEADFVSLHLPSDAANRAYLNEARLAQLPARCWLVNTARGAVVDEAALFDALAAGRLAGAALDVYWREPYEPVAAGKDFRTLSNVILTPHVGSSTREACGRMAAQALHNIRLAEAGRYGEMNLLNREVLARLAAVQKETS